MILISIKPSTQELTIGKIDSELGYAEIFVGNTDIVSKYDFIIHSINVNDITSIVTRFRDILSTLENTKYTDICGDELREIEKMVKTFLPARQKRGLFNAGGSALNFLFGTMDNDDREAISAHLAKIDENSHNLIDTVNHQIQINDNFNKSILQIKVIMEHDRIQSLEKLKQINENDQKLFKEDIAISELFKIGILKQKVQTIQQAIVSTKLGLLQTSMLTREEIERFGIDFYKLSNIRLVIAEYGGNRLNFIIKVPSQMVKAEKILVLPVPNSQKEQIDEELEVVVNIMNSTYSYEENKSLFELKISEHCIVQKRCDMDKNDQESIVELSSDILILFNMQNALMSSTRNQNSARLNGHYFINFNNCTI